MENTHEPWVGRAAARDRRERREEIVRLVEVVPRSSSPDRRPGVGFTRNVSASGLCLEMDEAQPVGSLLRLTLRGLDDEPWHSGLARVVWCRADRAQRYCLGLKLLEAVPAGRRSRSRSAAPAAPGA